MSPDSAEPPGAARGRKPAPANRTRQQLLRERALQLAAQRAAGAGNPGLPPEQQLTRPPPREEPAAVAPAGAQRGVPAPAGAPAPRGVPAPAGAPAPAVRLEAKPCEVKQGENPLPAAEDQTPVVKELEKQEVEMLVWFCSHMDLFSHGSVLMWFCSHMDLFSRGSVLTWICSHVVLFSRGSVLMWFCSHMVLFSYGSVLMWFCSHMVLFSYGEADLPVVVTQHEAALSVTVVLSL